MPSKDHALISTITWVLEYIQIWKTQKVCKSKRHVPVANSTSNQRPSGHAFVPDGVALARARLRFNFLKLSPSYAAGCHQLTNGGVKPKVNAQGRAVLKTIDRYGDVSKVKFKEWALTNAHTCMPDRDAIEIRSGNDLKSFAKIDLVMCFPNGINTMTDRDLLAFIKAHVPVGEALPRLTPVITKNLWKNIYLSYLTFSNPQEELWRLGAEAMLVDRLVGKINPAGKRMNSSEEHERRHLTLTVVRHKQWAFNVAEHAAVDDFPCKEQFGAVQGGFDFFDADRGEQLFAAGPEEFAHARAQVIKCSGASHKVSVKPTLDHQGLLF